MKLQLCETATEEDILKYQDRGYYGELKLDGVRAVAEITQDKVNILGRSENNYNQQFFNIVETLKGFPYCVLDGEIVTSDGDFNHVASVVHTQNKMMITALNKKYKPIYYIFDVLEILGEDLRGYPLSTRKKVLDFLKLYQKENVRVLDYTDNIMELWADVKRKNQEGIIVKNPNAHYDGKRSNAFVKIKFFKETQLRVNAYEINNAGITATDGKHRVQVAGHHSRKVKELIDKNGEANIIIQYLNQTQNGQYRFISYRDVVTPNRSI